MLAKGCFAVCAPHPLDHGRFSRSAIVGRMRSFCETDEEIRLLASPDGRCLVGSIVGAGQDRWLSLRADEARGSAGAFDGWTYAPSPLAAHPELLGSDDLDPRQHGNGMFTAVAWQSEPRIESGDGAHQRAAAVTYSGDGAHQRAAAVTAPGTGARPCPTKSAPGGRSRKRAMLHFLTDPFGTTPLYYGALDGLFVCAASLPLVAALLGLRERDEEATAELLCFAEILTDATPLRGIRRAEPGTLYTWDAEEGVLSSARTWQPAFGEDSDPGVRERIDQAAEAFARAVRRTVAAAHAPLHAALTGGLDSRTVWAVLLHDRTEATAVVHAAAGEDGRGMGHDLAIARMIARRFGITLKEVLLGGDFLREAAGDLHRFLRATNGLCNGDLMHLPYLYRKHAAYAPALVDGVNSYGERRHGLRRAAAGARTREELSAALWNTYSKPGLTALLPAEERGAVIEAARDRLARFAPDPREFPSPVAAAEHLYLTRLIGRHGHDAAAMQNHGVRFMTPYFDLEYVEVLQRVPEPLRAAERVQDAVQRRFAPALRALPRSYADVRTLPVAWRPLRLLPVAAQRLLVDRLPAGVRRRLDLRRGGSGYARWFAGPLAPLFDDVRERPAPFDAAAVGAFLDGLAAGRHGDTATAGFLLGQFSDRWLL